MTTALQGLRHPGDTYLVQPLHRLCRHGYRRWKKPGALYELCPACPPISVYVASSWRNNDQLIVVETLRKVGLEVYDFKNPPGGTGFHWRDVGVTGSNTDPNAEVPVGEFLAGLQHPTADAGFASDFEAMSDADLIVLVLPCGRSAHLELGWAAGAGKLTAVLLDDPCTPELMYKMVDYLTPSVQDLLSWLGVRD